MRAQVHVHGSLALCKGVTRGQIEAALEPWLEYLDVDSLEEAKSVEPGEPGIVFDEPSRALDICWSGDVGRSFYPLLDEALQALGPYTEHAAEIEVIVYYDNGDDETQYVFVGPTPKAIHEAQRRRMGEDVSDLLSRHFDQHAVDQVVALVNELFARDWAEKSSQGGSAKEKEVSAGITPPGRRHLH